MLMIMPHRARVVVRFKEEAGIQSLPWCPFSADLNPVENVWDFLKRRLYSGPIISNLHDLIQRLQQEWLAMPQDYVDTLIGSMNRRIEAVIRANGGNTRY